MSDISLTGHAIYATVRASLRLASTSSELLAMSDLVALKDDLHATLAVIRGQIQSEESNDPRAIIDMSDWESESDEEREVEKEVGRGGGGTADGGRGRIEPLQIPGPYKMNPPDMDELPEYWYVVVRGTEVGIFTDIESSTRAVAGVTRHLIRVKTWSEAAKLYNKLYHTNGIVRLSA